MEFFFNSRDILNLLTLTGLEIILGIDNVIFIALLVEPLPIILRKKVRIYGLSIALILRIIMLFGASWMITLTEPLFEIFSTPIAYKNILLFVGGIFLVVKASLELKSMLGEEIPKQTDRNIVKSKLWHVVYQIIFIDIILSFDSIITAVGMSPGNLMVIIIAVTIAMFVMLVFSNQVGEFIYKNPSIKVLGLAFIVAIGLFLMGEALDVNIPKGYLYSALFFACITETINIFISNKHKIKK
jgi:predicted tellurium resistance membrane protein TerC